MSVMELIKRTLPFFYIRISVYALFALISFVFLGIMLGVGYLMFRWFEGGGVAFILLLVVSFSFVFGLLKYLERYVLYLVKAGHLSVITELLYSGSIPDGKGQVEYGKEQVVETFGATNVAFVVDQLVFAAVKQIQRWMLRVGNFLNLIPGAKNMVTVISHIMGVSLRYVDEAVLSYIMLRKKQQRDQTKGKQGSESPEGEPQEIEQEGVWKSACDGVVLYAQTWKKIIMTAAGIVAFVYILSFTVFLISAFPLMALANLVTGDAGAQTMLGFLALVGAYVITTVVKKALVDPIATIAMVRVYQLNIKNVKPKADLHAKLLSISSKFSQMVSKRKEEEKHNHKQSSDELPLDDSGQQTST